MHNSLDLTRVTVGFCAVLYGPQLTRAKRSLLVINWHHTLVVVFASASG